MENEWKYVFNVKWLYEAARLILPGVVMLQMVSAKIYLRYMQLLERNGVEIHLADKEVL